MAKGQNTIPVPGELSSVAVDGILVSSDGVKDYTKGKTQTQINKSFSDDIGLLQAIYEGLTLNDIVVVADHTAVASPQANTIYREQGSTTYSDWMYYGSAWKKMAEYDNATEDTPIYKSNNLTKSGGIKDYVDDNFKNLRKITAPFTASYGYHFFDNNVITSGTQNQTINYWISPFNKGDIIDVDCTITSGKESSAYYLIFACQDSPLEYAREHNNLVGLEVERISKGKISGSVMSVQAVIPYDNCYIVSIRNATHFSNIVYNYYQANKIPNQIEDLRYLYDKNIEFSKESIVYQDNYPYQFDSNIWEVVAGSNNNYHIEYSKSTFNKGDIIHFSGTATQNKRMTFCITHDNPAERVNLQGLEVFPLYTVSTNSHNYNIVIPEDNVYFVFYWHSENWNNDRTFTYWFTGHQKDKNKEIDDTLDGIKEDLYIKQEILSYTEQNYGINMTGKWGTSSSYKHGIITVTACETYIIESHTSNTNYAFVTSTACTAGQEISNLVSGTSVYNIPNQNKAWIIIPSGTSYLVFNSATGYNTKIYKSLSAADILSGESLSDYLGDNYYTTVTNAKTTSGVVITGDSNPDNCVRYINTSFRKDVLLKIKGLTTTSKERYYVVGFTATNPASLADLGGLVLDNYVIKKGTTIDIEVNVPYNNAYVVYALNVQYMRDAWSIYLPDSFDNKLNVINEKINDLSKKTPEVDAKTYQYKERIIQAKFVSTDNSVTPALGLIHFSDFHEDMEAGKYLSKYITQFEDYIDDVISTGDVVRTRINKYSPDNYFNVADLADRSLFVLGNHDQAYSTNPSPYFWTDAPNGPLSTLAETIAASHEYSYERYIKDYHLGWGVTMPEGYNDSTSPYYQACYWHKDYTAQKIRMIGLDCMYRFDGILKKDGNGNFVKDNNGMLEVAVDGDGIAKLTTEQETWFYNLLQETLDSNSSVYGYSVIVLSHYPLDDFSGQTEIIDKVIGYNTIKCNTGHGQVVNHRTGDNVVFCHALSGWNFELEAYHTMRNHVPADNSIGYTKGEVNNVGDIIEKFMDAGGNFVAYICGHLHTDIFYYPTKYPNILCVSIDQTGQLRPTNYGARPLGMEMRLAANYYSIDTANHYFKIVRLGETMEKYLRKKEYLCYDYINRTVISEG